jgi:branched-chain amino acid transport system permease protein
MWQQLVYGVVEGAMYALIALGYTMVYGILGMINFAHGEIFMVGGYAGVLATGLLLASGASPALVLLLAAGVLFAMVASSAWGTAMERVAYRPLRGAPVLCPLIVAIGSSFFLSNLVMVCQGNVRLRAPSAARDWLVTARIPLGGDVFISALEISILAVAAVMMVGLTLFIRGTRLGRAMRATAQDRTMAGLMGVPIDRVIAATFLIGSALAAVAGFMWALYNSSILYTEGYLPGMKAFTAAVLGGIGNVPGAMLGGFILGIVEGLGVGLVSSDYKHVYAFVTLLLVLLALPRGILGERVTEKV